MDQRPTPERFATELDKNRFLALACEINFCLMRSDASSYQQYNNAGLTRDLLNTAYLLQSSTELTRRR